MNARLRGQQLTTEDQALLSYRDLDSVPPEKRALAEIVRSPERLSAYISQLEGAIRASPAIPSNVTRLFRAENHDSIPLHRARRFVEQGRVERATSFTTATHCEVTALWYADVDHTPDSAGAQPMFAGVLGARTSRSDQHKVIYELELPRGSEGLAAYAGSRDRGFILRPGCNLRWVKAEDTWYFPQRVRFERVNVAGADAFIFPDDVEPERRLVVTLRVSGGGD